MLKENDIAIANLLKAIKSGKTVDVLSAQIEKRQSEHSDLEAQLAQEKMMRPVLAFEDVRYFFEKFKDGDASNTAFRTALVDTFINRVFLYDGDDSRAEIFCNASNMSINCAVGEPVKGSPMAQLARPGRLERSTLCLEGRCSILLSYGRIYWLHDYTMFSSEMSSFQRML